ncbi:MAG: hypothetical protein U0269_34930 [Polyangiales bacterium]
MSERTHITGVLEGPEGALLYVDASITVGNETFSVRKPARALKLVASSGKVYELSGFDHSKKSDRVELSGRWGELLPRNDFLALVDRSKIRKEATEIAVRAFVLRGGDRVEAEVTETGRAGSVIEARVRKVSVVRAKSSASERGASTHASDVAPTRRHRVVGVALGAPPRVLFARVQLAAGETHEKASVDCDAIDVRTDDGARVRIEGVRSATQLGEVRIEGTYGARANEPLAKLFARQAPGDHVAITIEGFAIMAGDRVAVDGTILDEALVENENAEGFRGAPSALVRAVTASRIAVGADAEALLDEPPKSERAPERRREKPVAERVRVPLARSTAVYAVIGALLFVGSLLAGWVAPLVSARAWLTPSSAMGIALLLVALNRWLRAVHHGSYVSRAGGGARVTSKSAVWGYPADVVFLIACAMTVPMTAIASSPHIATVFYGVLLVISLTHATLLAVQEAPFRRFASIVLGAPTDDPRSGRMVLVEGTVKTEGASLVRTVDFFWQTETTYSTDQDGNQRESQSSTLFDREHTAVRSSTIELESSGLSGAILVEPARAHAAFSQREWKRTGEVSPYTESLSRGDPVCVVARFEDEGGALVARAGGEESLFMWAGTRSQLAAARLAAWGRIALIAAAGVVLVMVGTRVLPFAARYRARATVSASTTSAAPQGSRCELTVLAYRASLGGRCKLELVCNGTRIYGGWAMGETDCALPERATDTTAHGSDTSTSDGDPAIEFDLGARTLRWSDAHRQSATLALDGATSALWL